LARRLAEVLADPALRDRMGRAARARVERAFTWQTVAERTQALYGAVLAERARPAVAPSPAAPDLTARATMVGEEVVTEFPLIRYHSGCCISPSGDLTHPGRGGLEEEHS